MRRFVLGTGVALCLLFASPAVPHAGAGGARADYARAAAMAKRVRGKVLNASLKEAWVDDETLVYRSQQADGTWQYVRVDAKNGRRGPAFDHDKVATQVGQLLRRPLDATRLDLRTIDRVDGHLRVRAGSRAFRIEEGTDKVKELDLEQIKSLHLEPDGPGRSVGGGDDTSILFVNRSSQVAQLLWLDHAGKEKPYGKVKPGKERAQHTFRGHAWVVRLADGTNRGPYRGRREPGVVVIEDGGDIPARARGPNPSSALSPDGMRRVVIRESNIVLIHTLNKKEVPLSTDGTPEDRYVKRWRWSPDSRYLMVVKEEPADKRIVYVVNSVPDGEFQPRLISYPYLKPGDKIARPRPVLFDTRKRKRIEIPETLFAQPWSISNFSWSADGKRFRFLYNERGHQTLRLVELDAGRGAARAIIDETSETFVDYSQKTYLRAIDDNRAWLWMSERSGWNHLYRIGDKSGKATAITSGEWLVRRVLDVNEEAGTVRFEALGVYADQDPYHVHIGRVGLDGKGLVWLTDGDGTHSLRFSPDASYYVDTWSRVDQPPVHELRRSAEGERVVELERADWSSLLATGWQPTRRFKAKGRDGKTDIWGVLHLPSTFDESKRYPVIESIYAGPHGHFVPKRFRAWSGAKQMAELGFVVVQIDGMGTNWRHKAFHDVCWKNLGDSGFADRIAWLRAAAKTRPYLDLDRLGIYGGSAGGQSALRALLAHGDFYDAAVADCGCHDNRMDKIWWNEAWMGWPIGPHYEEQSNITQAHRLAGKLLLIVGEVDRNVDPASTMKVVDALIKADKDFDLVVIPGVGHGAAGTPYGRRRQADFFVRHLLGVEPRAK